MRGMRLQLGFGASGRSTGSPGDPDPGWYLDIELYETPETNGEFAQLVTNLTGADLFEKISGDARISVAADGVVTVSETIEASETINFTARATNTATTEYIQAALVVNADVTVSLPPTNTALPTIDNTSPAVDDELTGSVGTWTGSPTSYTYQWYRDDVAISGATNTTYTVVEADEDAVLTFGVIAINAAGSSVEAISAGTDPVEAAPVGGYAYESWTGAGWFDFSDTSTLTLSGSSITGVANKRTGKGDLTYAGTSGRVTTVAAAQNGLAVARHVRDVSTTSSAPRLVASTSDAISTMFVGNDKPFTAIYAYKRSDSNTGFVFSASAWSGGVYQAVRNITRGTPNCTVSKDVNAINGINYGSGHSSDVWRVIAIKHTGTAVTIWDNSTTAAVSGSAQDVAEVTLAMQFALFASRETTSSADRWHQIGANMDLGEIVIEDSAKSDADIQQAISDLATKWAITLS